MAGMKPLRHLLPLAGMLSLLLAEGCGNPCLKLADQICSCQPDQVTQSNCQQRARDQDAIFNVRAQDEHLCQQLLDSHACDCTKLDTPEGRSGCGIAFSVSPADGPVSR
jgi:hypothetical protein